MNIIEFKNKIFNHFFWILCNKGFFNEMNDEKYLKWRYKKRFKKKLNLNDPQEFNEKLQWLKLHDRKPEYTKMVDKYEVKKYVADIIGEEYIIPTLGIYKKFEDIDFDKLPNQFVIKCTHDSGGVFICKDKNTFDIEKARKKLNKSLKRNYYFHGREWPYKNVKPRIIIEKYISDNLNDYKVFCFNEQPKITLVCSDRFLRNELKKTWFDEKWNSLDLKEGGHDVDYEIQKPQYFEKMKLFSKELAKNIPFIRVDWYEANGRLYFGELTFYPNSGFERFEPEVWNYKFGKWIKLSIK